MYYSIQLSRESDGIDLLEIGFGAEAAGNDKIVVEAYHRLKDLHLPGGKGVRINGPASLPVAVTIAHAVAHLYAWVGVYDPKLQGYVVAVSHSPDVLVGQVLPLPETD